MKNVAIAFYGIPRSANVCFPEIQKKMLEPLAANFNIRCFYHFYQKSKVYNPRSGEDGDFPFSWYDYFSDFEGTLEQPEKCLDYWDFDRIKSYGDAWSDDYQSLSNLIHQLNSLHCVTNNIQHSQFDPDCVIFLRPDLFYHSSIPNRLILKASGISQGVAWIPAWQWFGGLNDRFSVCSGAAFPAYGKRIESIPAYLETHNQLHAESLLKFRLMECGIDVRPMFVNASRVRIGGRMKDENFSYRTCMDRDRTSVPMLSKLMISQSKQLFNQY